MKRLMLILCLLVASPVQGATRAPAPGAFAYGSKLELQGNKAFYFFNLPLEVYRSIISPNLDDIRVFNGNDQVVPHVLKRPAPTAITSRRLLRAEIPFFPLMIPEGEKLDNLTLHLNKNKQGTSIDIQSTDGQHAGGGKKLVGYLIDTSTVSGTGSAKVSSQFRELQNHLKPPRQANRIAVGQASMTPGNSSSSAFGNTPIQALALNWDQPQSDFLGTVDIATSSNLIDWAPLTTATLARLDHQGYQLDLRSIKLPAGVRTYLRLTWPETQEPLLLKEVEGQAAITATFSDKKLDWLSEPAPVVLSGGGSFVYDIGGYIPVEKIQLSLAGKNSMAVATVSSAAKAGGPYIREWQGLLYNLNNDGSASRNPEIEVQSRHHRYWRVSFAESEAGPVNPPVLNAGWQPDQLMFLAQGDGPFRLLYGSADVQAPRFDTTEMFRRYKGVAGSKPAQSSVKVGERFVQGGEIMLKPQPPPPNWRKYILWLVLASGVALIGWLSHSLYRQLQGMDANEDTPCKKPEEQAPKS